VPGIEPRIVGSSARDVVTTPTALSQQQCSNDGGLKRKKFEGRHLWHYAVKLHELSTHGHANSSGLSFLITHGSKLKIFHLTLSPQQQKKDKCQISVDQRTYSFLVTFSDFSQPRGLLISPNQSQTSAGNFLTLADRLFAGISI
jgi:hypothetical protein